MTSTARPRRPGRLTVTTSPAPVVVDGRSCRTRAAFFDEAARVLRLPGYFGRNWDALTDSLRDITADGRSPALVVDHAEELLADEPPGQLTTLLAVLTGAAAEGGLTVTLCTDAAHEDLLRRRLPGGTA